MSSRESTEQGRSGRRGAEAEKEEGTGKQPRQGSNRVEAAGDQEPKHTFEEGRAPSEQGDGNPSPETIKRNQQGLAGGGTGQSGSHGSRGDRSEESAEAGSPREEHTRHGRQSTPGDRSQKQ
jgi:hypothetical protein